MIFSIPAWGKGISQALGQEPQTTPDILSRKAVNTVN